MTRPDKTTSSIEKCGNSAAPCVRTGNAVRCNYYILTYKSVMIMFYFKYECSNDSDFYYDVYYNNNMCLFIRESHFC